MKTVFGIFVIFAVLATASATKKGDDSLLSALSRERQETKRIVQHENKALRDENTKLQREDDKLRRRDEQLQKQIYKMREEKLKDEIDRQKKEILKLRHADRRQRDQVDGFEKKMKELIRQEDVVLETKKREAQTSNSSKKREAVSEVDITGGSASATSTWGNSYLPDYAFIRGKAHSGWNSGSDAKNLAIFPQMVWYDFGHGNGFVPARITFKGIATNDNYPQGTPSVWEFVGSNDEVCSGSGNWTVLCQDLSHDMPQKAYDTKFCDVNNSDPNVEPSEYRCLGINVIRTHSNTIYVSNARMWKNVIQSGGVKNGTRF